MEVFRRCSDAVPSAEYTIAAKVGSWNRTPTHNEEFSMVGLNPTLTANTSQLLLHYSKKPATSRRGRGAYSPCDLSIVGVDTTQEANPYLQQTIKLYTVL